MGIHGFWNISMVAGPRFRTDMLISVAFTVMPILVLLLLVAYQYFLYREGQWIRTELDEEAIEGTIPSGVVSSLVSPLNRFRKRGTSAKQYVDTAMKLAWKRRHWKRAVGLKKERLWLAIVELRQTLKRIPIFEQGSVLTLNNKCLKILTPDLEGRIMKVGLSSIRQLEGTFLRDLTTISVYGMHIAALNS